MLKIFQDDTRKAIPPCDLCNRIEQVKRYVITKADGTELESLSLCHRCALKKPEQIIRELNEMK